MRKRKSIFLSYRRDDNPGYVRRLQDDLQRYFGKESVFLDVEDIVGGQRWKDVLVNNLANSAALIVVIGPRWEQIWNERRDHSTDYIVYELNKARQLGVPVYPVTINGAGLSSEIDLGPIDWLMDQQVHDISDRQGRWPTDVLTLVDILQHEKGLFKKKQKPEKSRKRWLVPAAIALLVMIGLLNLPDTDFMQSEYEPVVSNTPEIVEPVVPAVSTEVVASPEPVAVTEPEVVAEPVAASETGSELQTLLTSMTSTTPADITYPDIAGFWQSQDGYQFEIGEVEDGSFLYGNAEFVGYGQFIPNMPRKFTVQIAGLGYGEYSVSANNNKIIGSFYNTITYTTEYLTFYRVNY